MENKPQFRPNPNLKLMDQVREVLRYHHYADVAVAGSGHAMWLNIKVSGSKDRCFRGLYPLFQPRKGRYTAHIHHEEIVGHFPY